MLGAEVIDGVARLALSAYLVVACALLVLGESRFTVRVAKAWRRGVKITYECLDRVNARFRNEFVDKLCGVLESSQFILGNEVGDFESRFANYIKYDEPLYGVGVASGLDALRLALMALDLEEGSEVIVPANTYIATILSIVHNRLKPVMVDPDLLTYNITPEGILQHITGKTKAVVVVHLYGKMCRMQEIAQICDEYKLALVEDCAQAHGSKIKMLRPEHSSARSSNYNESAKDDLSERKAGSYGLSCFSFYPTKNLGALGDGGMIVTKDINVSNKLKSLRNYGSHEKYHNRYLGINSRLDSIQAAFLNVKLNYIDDMLEHRRELARCYLNNLKDDFVKPLQQENYVDTFHIFNIRHPKRDMLKRFLQEHEIETEIHYPIPPHNQPALHGIVEEGEFMNSEEIHSTTLSLPISFGHREDEIYRVIDIANKF